LSGPARGPVFFSPPLSVADPFPHFFFLQGKPGKGGRAGPSVRPRWCRNQPLWFFFHESANWIPERLAARSPTHLHLRSLPSARGVHVYGSYNEGGGGMCVRVWWVGGTWAPPPALPSAFRRLPNETYTPVHGWGRVPTCSPTRRLVHCHWRQRVPPAASKTLAQRAT